MHGSSRRFGGGASSPTNEVAVDTTKLYETLGVDKSATAQEIKKAYRKLSLIHHPDKGGEDQRFQEISAAYQVLSDEDQRKKYDRYGLEGLKDDHRPNNAPDIFDIFFGGRRRNRGAGARPRRGQDVTHKLNLSLEDLYNGKSIKMAVNRSKIVGTPVECATCDGHGIVLEIRPLGLGMVQQVKRQCPNCQGAGCHVVREKERKVIEVVIEKGMRHGDKVVFEGMGDDQPRGAQAGNVNFMVQEREHETFKRKGNDLLMHKTLTLSEALTGFCFSVTHLDQRKVVIQSKPGEVIPPVGPGGKAFCKMIPNEGMPSRGNPFVRGNLYVHFSVKFPSDGELSAEAVSALRQFLPGGRPSTDKDKQDQQQQEEVNAEVAHLSHTDMRNFGKGGILTQTSESSSDSDEATAEGVQCQQS